jgi:hypothetical protein
MSQVKSIWYYVATVFETDNFYTREHWERKIITLFILRSFLCPERPADTAGSYCDVRRESSPREYCTQQ